MFSQKRKNLVRCDAFVDLYKGCSVGCEMCKFNKKAISEVVRNKVDFSCYLNKKVLLCYSTDPYVFDDFNLVEQTIDKLHNNLCSVVFLTRKANCLLQQLHLFNKSDIVGVSISENCSTNSDLKDVIELFSQAKNWD